MRGRLLVAAIGAGALLTGGFAACTTFDGLVATLDEDSPLAGAGGDAGAGGKAGAAGASGGADGGLDAKVDAPPAAPGFLSLADGARVCQKLATCPGLAVSTVFSTGVPVDAVHFSSCLSWMSGPLPSDHQGRTTQASFLACIAQAKTCENATACLWYEEIAPGDPRCKGVPDNDAGNGACLDSKTVGDCPYAIFHCDNAYWGKGAECYLDPVLQLHTCGVPKGCTKPGCDGDLLSGPCSGDGKPAQSNNCAAIGAACGVDSLGNFDCLSNGVRRQCVSGDPVAACDGDQVSACSYYFGFLGTLYNCASLGGVCDSSKGLARCKLPTEACSPYDPGVDTCKGSVISLCVGGQPATFDCASIGLTCKPGNSGLGGRCN